MYFPVEVKAKVRILCPLQKVIYSPPYRDPTTRTRLGGTTEKERLHATSESCFGVAGATGTIPGLLAKLSAGLNHTSY